MDSICCYESEVARTLLNASGILVGINEVILPLVLSNPKALISSVICPSSLGKIDDYLGHAYNGSDGAQIRVANPNLRVESNICNPVLHFGSWQGHLRVRSGSACAVGNPRSFAQFWLVFTPDIYDKAIMQRMMDNCTHYLELIASSGSG